MINSASSTNSAEPEPGLKMLLPEHHHQCCVYMTVLLKSNLKYKVTKNVANQFVLEENTKHLVHPLDCWALSNMVGVPFLCNYCLVTDNSSWIKCINENRKQSLQKIKFTRQEDTVCTIHGNFWGTLN